MKAWLAVMAAVSIGTCEGPENAALETGADVELDRLGGYALAIRFETERHGDDVMHAVNMDAVASLELRHAEATSGYLDAMTDALDALDAAPDARTRRKAVRSIRRETSRVAELVLAHADAIEGAIGDGRRPRDCTELEVRHLAAIDAAVTEILETRSDLVEEIPAAGDERAVPEI